MLNHSVDGNSTPEWSETRNGLRLLSRLKRAWIVLSLLPLAPTVLRPFRKGGVFLHVEGCDQFPSDQVTQKGRVHWPDKREQTRPSSCLLMSSVGVDIKNLYKTATPVSDLSEICRIYWTNCAAPGVPEYVVTQLRFLTVNAALD